MSDVQLDSAHKSAMVELGQSLNRNFDRIDQDKNGELSRSELNAASEGPKLSVADRALAKFASEHMNELASLYNGFNRKSEEQDKTQQVLNSKEEQSIQKDDVNVLLRAAGDMSGRDPFTAQRRILVGIGTASGAAYGGVKLAIGGPLAALAGVGLGGGVGYGVSRLSTRLTHGTSDNYYQQKSEILQKVDLAKFPGK